MSGAPNPLFVESRAALLDVLDALGEHADRVVLVGAQAIYLWTGAVTTAVAPFTKDADVALIPPVGPDPALEDAMRAARLQQRGNEPGIWIREGAQVDLLVPEALAASKGRRSVRLDGHSPTAARWVKGLEGAAVDNDEIQIAALAADDSRTRRIRVAGPGALLVSKLHKIAERAPSPALNKDAHDVYRLLRAVDTNDLALRVRRLLDDPLTAPVTQEAMGHLRDLFGEADAPGAAMAGANEEGIGDPANVAASVAALASDLLEAIDRTSDRA